MNSSAVEHIYTLRRSAFKLAPIIHSFYLTYPKKENNLLLSYLLLPLILYKPMCSYLVSARSTSNIKTACSEAERLYGLESRVQELKSATSAAMMLLFASDRLEIENNLTITANGELQEEHAHSDHLTAATKLAKILSDIDVAETYRVLGLKKL
ncbi:three component ABC system middle component [Pseudomonas marginalis]|uniref:Uncharacterized protein n=1 Tax=Pseudomonas marginalis TaxID=298 RepID=A0A9X9BR30_PSEMA|nr:three component ABC system middle component [Pseudomonas marginalis]TWR58163.1 hypothetical protein FIV41_18250 [Pseudomonas marginalis]